jgi:hypothetical protein
MAPQSGNSSPVVDGVEKSWDVLLPSRVIQSNMGDRCVDFWCITTAVLSAARTSGGARREGPLDFE